MPRKVFSFGCFRVFYRDKINFHPAIYVLIPDTGLFRNEEDFDIQGKKYIKQFRRGRSPDEVDNFVSGGRRIMTEDLGWKLDDKVNWWYNYGESTFLVIQKVSN